MSTNYDADMAAIADSKMGYPLGKPVAEDPDDICECEHFRDEHNESRDCLEMTMERRAKCSCLSFKLAVQA